MQPFRKALRNLLQKHSLKKETRLLKTARKAKVQRVLLVMIVNIRNFSIFLRKTKMRQ